MLTVAPSLSVMSSAASVGSPPGRSALTEPVLSTLPASMSAWVIVYVAVHVAVSPGSRVAAATGQLTLTSGSLTVTLVRVTLPVFSRAKP